jgi:hypothetical protein
MPACAGMTGIINVIPTEVGIHASLRALDG